jgi:hypothetical protein
MRAAQTRRRTRAEQTLGDRFRLVPRARRCDGSVVRRAALTQRMRWQRRAPCRADASERDGAIVSRTARTRSIVAASRAPVERWAMLGRGAVDTRHCAAAFRRTGELVAGHVLGQRAPAAHLPPRPILLPEFST